MSVAACLHTAASNVGVFDAACPPGLVLTHAVHPDLLAEAAREGGLTEAVAERTAALLRSLAAQASAVLLTCSSLGGAVARLSRATAPVLRADAALADAVRGRVGAVVLCAAPTTLAPTRALFEGAAVRLVPGAWPLFQAGELAAYHRCIAAAAEAAFAAGATTVALAQASMTPAAAACRNGVPMTVPAAALAAVLRACA